MINTKHCERRPKEHSDRLPEAISPEVILKLRDAIKVRKTGDIDQHAAMGLPPSGTTHVPVRYSTLEALLNNLEVKSGSV